MYGQMIGTVISPPTDGLRFLTGILWGSSCKKQILLLYSCARNQCKHQSFESKPCLKPNTQAVLDLLPFSILKRRNTCYRKEGDKSSTTPYVAALSVMWRKRKCRVDMAPTSGHPPPPLHTNYAKPLILEAEVRIAGNQLCVPTGMVVLSCNAGARVRNTNRRNA